MGYFFVCYVGSVFRPPSLPPSFVSCLFRACSVHTKRCGYTRDMMVCLCFFLWRREKKDRRDLKRFTKKRLHPEVRRGESRPVLHVPPYCSLAVHPPSLRPRLLLLLPQKSSPFSPRLSRSLSRPVRGCCSCSRLLLLSLLVLVLLYRVESIVWWRPPLLAYFLGAAHVAGTAGAAAAGTPGPDRGRDRSRQEEGRGE